MKSKKTLFIIFLVSLLWAEGSLAQTFYGTTQWGGSKGGGTIYRLNGDGTGINPEYNFIIDGPRGNNADFSVMLAHPSNGLLYGSTMFGGSTNGGILFSYNPVSDVFVELFDFNDLVAKGNNPIGRLQLFNGLLYGVTNAGGVNYLGTIFTINLTNGAYEKLFDFTNASGSNPLGGLTLGPDNKLYGMASGGGSGGKGTLYQLDPTTKAVIVKHNFDGVTGTFPIRELTLGTNSLIYGMTVGGGANDHGALFEYNTSGVGTLTKKADFNSAVTGRSPIGSLLQSTGTGKFYGGTAGGGANDAGTIFEFDPVGGTITRKFDFTKATDGTGGFNILCRAADDKMYGSSENGGPNNSGVIFEYVPGATTVTVKLAISGYDHGYAPKSGLTLATNGKFYGLTAIGGHGENGTLFEWDRTSGALVRKIDFRMSATGITPAGNLIQAPNGRLLGVTQDGSSNGGGVIFEYDPITKVYNKLINLDDYTNKGMSPWAGMVMGNNGKFYGTSQIGGTGQDGPGILFEYDYALNTFTKKIDFGILTHGGGALEPMVIVGDLAIGTMRFGAAQNFGCIFEYNYVTNTFTRRYDFVGTDGAYPNGKLLLASDGMIYGVTNRGGNADNQGVLYQYNPVTRVYTVKAVFDPSKGTNPEGGLIEVDGKMYGMGRSGGGNGRGTLYEYDMATGQVTKKVDMDFHAAEPGSTLTRGPGKKLYGYTQYNGDYGLGVIFEYDITEDKFAIKEQFAGPNGARPGAGALLAVRIPPLVTALEPEAATVGSSVLIKGANFSGNIADNVVYFGGVKAKVTAAKSTELTVTVPPGANFPTVSVTVNGLTGSSPKPFVVKFPGGAPMTDNSFESKNDFTTGDYPLGAITADLDSDGRPEVIVANHSGNSVSIYPNLAIAGKLSATSLGSKLDFPVSSSPIGLAAGDVDGDGKLDLVVTNTNNLVSVFRNKSTGVGITAAIFDARVDFTVGNNSFDVAIGEIDGDGRLDIVTANASGPSISVLRNTSTPGVISASSFAPKVDIVTSSGINKVEIWDIDGDKHSDIITAHTSGSISIFRNLATPGSFLAASLAPKVDFTIAGCSNISIGDYDGDGDPDIAASSSAGTVKILKNTSTPGVINTGSLAAPVDVATVAGPSASFGDVDGDGKIDLVSSSSNNNNVRVFINESTASVTTFTSKATVLTGNGPGYLLLADMDIDGKPDFITLNNTNTTLNQFSVIHNNILAAEPSAQPATLVYSNVSSTGMTVGFTGASGAEGYLVLMSSNVAPTFDPTDAIAYPGDAVVGQAGVNNIIVAYAGPNTSFTVEEIPASTSLFFRVFAYKGSASVINYNLAAPLTGTHSTLATEPTAQATNIAVVAAPNGAATVTFTAGNGSSRLVVLKAGSVVDASPPDGTGYTPNNALASAPQLGTGNFIVGNATPTTVTGLTPGATYHFRVFEFNGDAGLQNYNTGPAAGNPAVYTADATPPNVTLIPVAPVASGSQLTITATVIDDGSPVTDVTLSYRSIAIGGTPSTKKMTKGTGDTYAASIEGAEIGELGIEYKIRATSGGGTSADPDKYRAVPVASPTTGITVSYDAFGNTQANYRIIAVPLSLSPGTVQTVFDELGTIDRKKWRLSHYNANGVTSDLGPTEDIQPGLGYWLIIKTAGGAINTPAGNTVVTSSDANFSIDLTNGWNQIGNPYPFNLLWQDVIDANPGLTKLRTYRSDNPAGGDYPWGDGVVLRAKEGGFINNTGGLTKLKFPVLKKSAATRTQEDPFVSSPLTDRNWQLYIVAKHNTLVNGISGIGMHERASERGDQLDGYSMPRFFDRYLELNHGKNSGDDLMSMDIVPTSTEYTWSFDIESSETDQYITLEWDNSNFGDNEMGLILWDEARQYAVDMRSERSYVFDRTISKKFKVYFGRSDKLGEKIEIKGLVLHSVSPNPAEGEVKVAFTVPTRQQVEFEALDLLGRAVWKASGNYSKGYHEVLWGGETRAGARGLYIIRMKSGDETIASRIYLK